MSYYSTEIREEELKNNVADDWFGKFNTRKIVGNVDFCVAVGERDLIWGEAKRGIGHDIYESFVQLLLTIGRARTFDNNMPPSYLCAFDAEKIAFIEYSAVIDIFYQNDFNWNVTPSNHKTKEFQQLKERAIEVLEREKYLYNYEEDSYELTEFIKHVDKGTRTKLQVDKNNFVHVYLRWLDDVKDSIAVDWGAVKQNGYVDADFFLADLLSKDNATILEKLVILLERDHYKYWAGKGLMGELFGEVEFNDNQKAHTTFWNKYERPPRKELWDYIVERRDLLVPQDIRERKGSFFTPRKWVERSQEYLARVLGENWQDEYYIWDCCAGTGNLLLGLKNSFKIFASTIDQADVDIIHSMIDSGSRNLAKGQVFRFDFLNDDFKDLPERLREIINDPEKRKKLVIYINPPYAEAGNARTPTGTGEHKTGVAVEHATYKKYFPEIGLAGRELFAQFLIRIDKELPGCIIGQFSKLKHLQGPNFKKFREAFQPKLKSVFIIPAFTFDNVIGKFPIGFHIWDTGERELFTEIEADVYGRDNFYEGTKRVFTEQEQKNINDWIIETRDRAKEKKIGYMSVRAHDISHQNYIFFVNDSSQIAHPRGTWITDKNWFEVSIYLAVCQCIKHIWLNDRDQFLYPKDTWKKDKEFHSDCLAYTLFHGQNRISCKHGVNHFIPFRENDIMPKTLFASHFMIDYIAGEILPDENKQLFNKKQQQKPEPVVFSAEAQRVMECGRKLFEYYHKQKDSEPDASIYDIRLYFQGTDAKGRMNAVSGNETYNGLLQDLRNAQKILSRKIERKVYEHGFLEN